jgi:hypothetical protein
MRILRGPGIIFVAVALLAIQGVGAAAQIAEPLYVIDKPTAGILEHGSYLLMGRVGPESSFLADVGIGFRDRFQIGVSYGMQKVFESGSPEFNDRPGFQVRVRILEETGAPALAVGFDSQGFGAYHGELERYDRKSVGFYGVVSKNWALALGELSLHGGVSLSLEDKDDNGLNPFAGIDWRLFDRLSFLLDADAALNDNSSESLGKGGVYIDTAVRWFIADSWAMSLIFRDLSGNSGVTNSVGREFELMWIDFF